MDSFEMYGELMNQYDSLLPPGEIRKKILDTALMGLESKGGGGGGGGGGVDPEIADLNHQQNMNNYNYSWDRAQDRYNHQLLQNEVQRRDMLAQNQWQEANQEQQWMYANAMKEQKYNAEMAAFNKSEKMYGWQVDMNQISADMARDEQLAQTEERYQALSFETQAAALQYGAKKTDLSLQGMGADLDISSKRTAGQRQKQSLTIDQQTKRGMAAAVGVEDTVKGMQAAGQVEAKGQAGGSAAKQYQSMVAQSSRLQAAKAFELNRSDLATRLALNGVDQTLAEQEAVATLSQAKIGAAGLTADAGYKITKSSLKNAENYMKDMYSLGVKQRAATNLSIGGAHDRATKKIAHDQYAANVQADFNRMSKPSMGIPIPKPLEIPMATIMDPIIPVKGEKPVWGAGMGAGSSSAGSTGGGGMVSSGAMGAGGLMMGAAAIPASTFGLTTGGALGAAPGLGFLGPVGLGFAALGMLGGSAGWF